LDLVGVQIRSYWHTECACGKILAFGTDNFGTYWGTEGKADGQTEGWWCVVKMDRGQLKEREREWFSAADPSNSLFKLAN